MNYGGQEKGAATARTYQQRTHFPYETGSNEAQTKLNMQFALHRAMNDGWQIATILDGVALLYLEQPGDLLRLADSEP